MSSLKKKKKTKQTQTKMEEYLQLLMEFYKQALFEAKLHLVIISFRFLILLFFLELINKNRVRLVLIYNTIIMSGITLNLQIKSNMDEVQSNHINWYIVIFIILSLVRNYYKRYIFYYGYLFIDF